MSEQLKNIIWMAEELDFVAEPQNQAVADSSVRDVLGTMVNLELSHRLYSA